ncbi:HNH endonuclease signature motif containing protein [Paenarthrobacter sp. RAF9]
MNTDGSIVTGHEAHIVGREENGPRGKSSLTPEERDDYKNLMLLCPTHHTEIDKAPLDYPVDYLRQIKADHEAWVRETLGAEVDKTELRWAQLVDQLAEKLSLDTWAADVHAFFDGGPITLAVTTEERLRECALWIAKRPWPAGQDKLKAAIRNMGIFLNELLSEFNVYAELHGGGEWRRYPAFYKISVWDTELYDSLLAKYKGNRTYLSDLTLEITRYINLFGDLVRADLDPSFRDDEGLVEVLVEGLPLEYGAYVPQFAEEDLEVALGDHALVAFKDSRASRAPRFKW